MRASAPPRVFPEFYERSLSETPLLSAEEELSASPDELVEHNLRLVAWIARRYQGRGLPLEDLISEGHLGLIEASRRWDPERGVRFASYAQWWVRQAMRRALQLQASNVRLPTNVQRMLQSVRRMEHRMLHEAGSVDDEALAEALGCSASRLETVRQYGFPELQLDNPLGGEGDRHGRTPLEYLPDPSPPADEVCCEADVQDRLRKAINSLPVREAQVLTAFSGLDGPPQTQGEISRSLGISRQHVQQVKDRALRRLRRRWGRLLDIERVDAEDGAPA